MSKAIKYLALLLVVQLAIVVSINLSQLTGSNGDNATQHLITNIDAYTEVTIKDKESSVTIKKIGENWILQDYADQPTAEGTVDGLLKRLADTKITWPVATSDAAAKRFEVATDNAQKTLVLSGDKVEPITFYLGTSPSYRKTHIRTKDNDEIYLVEVTQHELSPKPDVWMNKQVLQFPGDIASVKTDDFAVTANREDKDNPSWQVTPNDETKTIDSDKTKEWVERFNNIIVSKLLTDKDLEQTVVVQNPALRVNVKGNEVERDYAFYTHNDKFYVKQYGDTPIFELPKYEAEPLINATIDTFFIAEENAPEEDSQTKGDE